MVRRRWPSFCNLWKASKPATRPDPPYIGKVGRSQDGCKVLALMATH